ncbi:Signal recognition particle receptor subunit beta [Spathaspora sp. JA1]|nr:Signal recognition particle receptor subunit beta [Spathaspora sp. JA1]
MDYILVGLLTALAGFIIILAIFFFQSGGIKTIKTSSRSPYYKPSFLILGGNNSGKTSFYYKLLEKEQTGENTKTITSTVSSLEPNITEIRLPLATDAIGKKFQLVDYPGHLKYQQLFEKLLTKDITLQNVKGIIYVIDSSSLNFNDSDQVEHMVKFLYNLLAITERKQTGIDFLFAVNKTDLFDSVPIHKIQTILTSEIDKLIHDEISNIDKTSGIDKAIEDGDDSEESQHIQQSLREFWLSVIGSPDEKFTFDKLEGNMDFFGGSVLKNNVEKWENWIDEKVVNP